MKQMLLSLIIENYMNTMKKTKYILIVLLTIVYAGCYYNIPVKTAEARLGPYTKNTRELKMLPPPKEKIICAVYKFRDQTGQYKNVTSGSSWSTAVTQGTTSILTKSLEESGWFIPIEREGLANLLNERKIIRSSRENYLVDSTKRLPELPPLLYAGIMLEGGIISYETNVYTGGAGLKYFGSGGSVQYRQDQVTIYLRAVSTQNGRVLKTVYTTKTILSQAVDFGVYKFVELNQLLEAETGFSYNEPPQMCVTAAIEKAVQSLVIEGIFDKFWELAKPDDIKSPIIRNYIREKTEIENTSDNIYAGKKTSSVGIEINSGASFFSTDLADPNTKMHNEAGLSYYSPDNFYLTLSAGYSKLSIGKYINADLSSVTLTGGIYLMPEMRITPVLEVGTGLSFRGGYLNHLKKEVKKELLPSIISGLGVKCLIADYLLFNVMLYNNYYLSDKLDNYNTGRWNDYMWQLKTGFTVKF
jgi:curli production assembly/transport component CsgG